MKVVAAVAVLWIVGAFVTCAFVAGATRRGRYQEPKLPDEDLEKDLDAGVELALEEVFGASGPLSPPPLDRRSGAILERRVVRGARPGRAPIH